MEDSKKLRLFETMPIPKAVMNLAVPTVISSLVMVIYNLADTYFVGMLNDPVQNAAVTLAAPLMLAFNAVNNLFGVGASSMMSRALGRKDYETVKRSSAFGFYCAVISGILFSVCYTIFSTPALKLLGTDTRTAFATSEYLLWTVSFGATPAILNVVMAYMVRAEGASMHASIGTMSGCILNIILDPIFVMPWGLGMGAAGAGLATFISNTFACLYFAVLLFVKRGNTYVSVNPRMFSLNGAIVMGVCAVGIPAAIQNLLNVTGMTILNNFTAVFGADAVAAMGIAQKIHMVPMQIALGFSQGIMPLISYTYASHNYDRMKNTLTLAAKYSLRFLAVMTAVYFFFSAPLVNMFMENRQIIEYGSAFLKAMSLSLPFMCIDFLAVGVFQACGMGKMAFVFAILRKIVLEIPALYLLNIFYPLYGLAWARTITELFLAVAAVLVLRRFFKNVDMG